jgi:leader peptidase (prepilin peptidase)/N-methyltransferase
VPKDVRVTADELAIQSFDYLGDGELVGFGGHLCIEEHLQQQVAELFAQVCGVVALDRVQHFVGLFQRVFADGPGCLFAIPGATVRSAQAGHDGDGLCEQLISRSGSWVRLRLQGLGFRVHGTTVRDAPEDNARRCRENRINLAAVILIPMLYLTAAAAGLLFGSFLNVCIARLPRHASIAWPGSHCPRCAAPIRAWENVPLVSFVLLRGRCRRCRKPISWRYPLVEAGLAVLFVLCIGRISTIVLVESWVFCFLLLGLFVMDLETFRLPDAFTLPGLGLGLVQTLLPGDGLASQLRLTEHAPFSAPRMPALTGSLVGAAGAAATLLLIRWAYRRLRQRDGMGLGDVKLAAMLGAWLGVTGVALTFMLAVVLAAVAGLAAMAVLRRPAASLRLPFGSFLALGALLCLFMGEPLLRWYFSFWR